MCLDGGSHYYRNLNRDGQGLRSEAVTKTVSVNALTEAVFYNLTALVNRIKK